MNIMKKTLYFVVFTVFICGGLSQESQSTTAEQENEVEEESTFSVMYKILMDCTWKQDINICLKIKAVKYLDRALASKQALPLMEYITLARDPAAEEARSADEGTPPLTEEEIERNLPRSLEEKSDLLDKMVFDKVDALLRSRTLQLSLPTDVFEGRKKAGKKGGYLLAAGAAMAGMMMQMALGKVALIAGKALMVAKVALVLSAVVGLKKLVGGGGGGESHSQVVYASSGHGGGWSHRRSLDADAVSETAQKMAYSAHVTN